MQPGTGLTPTINQISGYKVKNHNNELVPFPTSSTYISRFVYRSVIRPSQVRSYVSVIFKIRLNMKTNETGCNTKTLI